MHLPFDVDSKHDNHEKTLSKLLISTSSQKAEHAATAKPE